MLDALGEVERPSLADDLGARGGGGDDDEAYASGATPPVERLRHNNRRVTICEIAVVKDELDRLHRRIPFSRRHSTGMPPPVSSSTIASEVSPPPPGRPPPKLNLTDQRRSDRRRSDLRGSAVAENHSERYSAENQSAGGRGVQCSDSEGEGEHSERFSAESYFAGERAARGLPLPFSAPPLHRNTTSPQASEALARALGSRRAEAAVASPQASPADRLLGRRAARQPQERVGVLPVPQ